MDRKELTAQIDATLKDFNEHASVIIKDRIKYREVFVQHLADWYKRAAEELQLQLEYGHLNAKFSVAFDHTMYNLTPQELQQCLVDFRNGGTTLPQYSIALRIKSNEANAQSLRPQTDAAFNPWATGNNLVPTSSITIEFFMASDPGDPSLGSIWHAISGDAALTVLSGLFSRPIQEIEKDMQRITKTELKSMVDKTFKWNYTFSHMAIKNVINGMVNPILQAKGFGITIVEDPLFLMVQLYQLA